MKKLYENTALPNFFKFIMKIFFSFYIIVKEILILIIFRLN